MAESALLFGFFYWSGNMDPGRGEKVREDPSSGSISLFIGSTQPITFIANLCNIGIRCRVVHDRCAHLICDISLLRYM